MCSLYFHNHYTILHSGTHNSQLTSICMFIVTNYCNPDCAYYMQLGKSPDDGIAREDFLLWAVERFKDSKTIANEDALMRIYRFQ